MKWTLVLLGQAEVFGRELADSRFDLLVLRAARQLGGPRNWWIVSTGYTVIDPVEKTCPYMNVESAAAQALAGRFTRLKPPFALQVGADRGLPDAIPESAAWAAASPGVTIRHNAKPRRFVQLNILPFFPNCYATVETVLPADLAPAP